MSRPRTYEQSLLAKAQDILASFSPDYQTRLLAVEACAALLGGFRVEDYWLAFGTAAEDPAAVKDVGRRLYGALRDLPIPPAMAVSSLSRETVAVAEQKKQGAFYTDFRLAEFVAEDCGACLQKSSSVADLAVGSGILLAGIAGRYFARFPGQYDAWISRHVFAFDLSENALRGARAALAVYTSSVNALVRMASHWRVCDTLLAEDLPGAPYDIVAGNPPWGKVKLSLHAFVSQSGASHVYGAGYDGFDRERYEADRRDISAYRKALRKRYTLLGTGEPDLYMAFLQRAMAAARPGGHLSYIVPASLIRAQGAEPLRRYLLGGSRQLKYSLFDNRPRFFEIDSRFKFLVLSQQRAAAPGAGCGTFSLSVCRGEGARILHGDEVAFDVSALEGVRPDLTVPECRSEAERDLFFKICRHGRPWHTQWGAEVAREVDMTNDRPDFQSQDTGGCVPVIEGRMVQQFRFGAKAYRSGSGRSARWAPCAGEVQPQFYMPPSRLSEAVQARIQRPRAGYCDIAGQTNERAMTAAVIPAGVVCGNKVPTIRFPGGGEEAYMYLWLGAANSFVFDWLLRRVLSTTVNYFLLFSLPMPDIAPDSPAALEIIRRAKSLSAMGPEFYTGEDMPRLRGEIEVLVAQAFGLSFSELERIMGDFPLLDRAQKPLEGEKRSTVTRDLVLSLAEEAYGAESRAYTQRYQAARDLGARAYIPTEMAGLCTGEEAP